MPDHRESRDPARAGDASGPQPAPDGRGGGASEGAIRAVSGRLSLKKPAFQKEASPGSSRLPDFPGTPATTARRLEKPPGLRAKFDRPGASLAPPAVAMPRAGGAEAPGASEQPPVAVPAVDLPRGGGSADPPDFAASPTPPGPGRVGDLAPPSNPAREPGAAPSPVATPGPAPRPPDNPAAVRAPIAIGGRDLAPVARGDAKAAPETQPAAIRAPISVGPRGLSAADSGPTGGGGMATGPGQSGPGGDAAGVGAFGSSASTPAPAGVPADLSKTNELLQQLLDAVRRQRDSALPAGGSSIYPGR